MNKKEGIPLIKKILICLMTIIMVMMSACIPSLAVQSYYNMPRPYITISVAAQDNFTSAIDIYIQNLQKQGYTIASKEIDKKEIKNQIVNKSTISIPLEDDLLQKIMNIKVYAVQITMNKEIFYFKNSTDALTFVNKINEQIKTEYSIVENIKVDTNEITSQDTLDEKIEDAKVKRQELEKQKREKELEKQRKEKELEKKKSQVTSRRNSTTRSSSNNNTNAPLKSYVYISSYYGARRGGTHTGVDFAAYAGTPIYAWKSGTITYRGWNGNYGNFVEIKHGDGTVSRYAHMSGYNCSLGDKVSAGETIGYVGTTGNSTGNHLHWEIKVNGNFVNPLNYL